MAAKTQASASDIEAIKKRIVLPGSDEFTKVCVYGRNGSGKTRFAGSAPNVLVVDINEEGDRSLMGQKNVRVIHVRTWDNIGNVYWYLQSGKHPFKSVALDTVTEMQATALSFVLGEAEERDPTREKQMPDKRTWGRAGQLMRGMLLAYRNLPMHVIFTAQERLIRDEDTQEITEITVDLPNSSRGACMGSVGVLGRLVPKEIRVKQGDGKTRKRYADHLILAPHEIMRTKDRTGLLGDVVRSPTMDQVIAAWSGGTGED